MAKSEEMAQVVVELQGMLASSDDDIDHNLRDQVLEFVSMWVEDLSYGGSRGEGQIPQISNMSWIAPIADDAGLSLDDFVVDDPEVDNAKLEKVSRELLDQVRNASLGQVVEYVAAITLYIHRA